MSVASVLSPAPARSAQRVTPPTTEIAPASPAQARWRWASRVLLIVSLIVWAVSLPHFKHAPVSQYGLTAAAGPALLGATFGVALAFVMAIRARSAGDGLAGVLALVVVTRATASIISSLPVYEWSYKHIGVVDHLSTTGHLARGVDIYNNWPGFFSASAWFSDVTGVSFLDQARWFPVGADLAVALGMYAVSRAFGQSVQVAQVAAFGIQTFNWVAQDYFSPQATAFALALPTIALLLRSRTYPPAAWFAVPLLIAATVTHQLTPFWLCGIAVLLGVTKRIRPRSIAVVFVLIAVAYAAANLGVLSPYGLFTGFDPISNAQSNIPTAGNAGRAFTSHAARVTSGLMWLSAIACAWRARRRGEPVWVPSVLAFTSFALLAGQSYGGEAIFRVFLYSTPGCLLLIAPVATAAVTGHAPLLALPDAALRRRRLGRLLPGRAGGTAPGALAPGRLLPRRWVSARRRERPALLTRLVAGAIAVIAIAGGMQAYYGTWFVNLVDRDGLRAEEHLLATAPTNALLMPLTIGIAERPTGQYVPFAANDFLYDNFLVAQPGILSSRFTPGEVSTITTRLAGLDRPVYLIISLEMRRYSTYFGLFPPGAIDRLVHSLAGSARWTALDNTPTLSIFRLNR